MYTLRRVTADDVHINQMLGSSYTVAKRNTKAFHEFFKQYCGTAEDQPQILGFVSYGNEQLSPLLHHEQNYIMLPDGSTFERIY